jgi:UDP-glucuronate 4-epimerase
MKILVTGSAGFIGFHLVNELVKIGHDVIGLDNINNYYDTKLKYDRLIFQGICKLNLKENIEIISQKWPNYSFVKMDLNNRESLRELFTKNSFQIVVNLAGQAGVRYSLEQPFEYLDSNVNGFLNVLENCRFHNVKKLLYASSSSVYGLSGEVPFTTNSNANEPVSLYAATKRTNELMAYTYGHLFNIESVGLRFFTVYGPWGRPDMAMHLFTEAILNNEPIKVFNNGNLSRDFTYVDDIVTGIVLIIAASDKWKKKTSIYNIGNSKPVELKDFIAAIENSTGLRAVKKFMPMQLGDVLQTWADVSDLVNDFGYNPKTSINDGVFKFVNWYRSYY